MKKITTLLFALFLGVHAGWAQLPDGSIAPNWTATDINGNSYTLYDILDAGKTVFIDFSATWCGPCWAYHNTGALENLYEQYGPGGTDEVMVFFIEGDETTTLADLNGTGGNTQGNWVNGTGYPIIDNASFNDGYNINYFPTIYRICPSRQITEVGQVPTDELYASANNCLKPFGVNNAGVLDYSGFSGSFCESQTFVPGISVQNLGTAALKSLTLTMSLNGNVAETINWVGNLNTFEMAQVTFSSVTLTANTQIDLVASNPNGTPDEDAGNNGFSAEAALSPDFSYNRLKLLVKTDNYPRETFWTVTDREGNILYAYGNPSVTGHPFPTDPYTNKLTVHSHDIDLPGDGCYALHFYDDYGDGICCLEGAGYYELKDGAGNVLISGGEFGEEIAHPFSLSGTTPIPANASMVAYDGPSGDFCDTLVFSPAVLIQNLGFDTLLTAQIELTDNVGSVLQGFDWSGGIAPGKVERIEMNPITMAQSTLLRAEIKAINGTADSFEFSNNTQFSLSRNLAVVPNLQVTIRTDNYGYETFWALLNEAGAVIASGGNTKVGLNGGGAQVAAAGDPGAYGNNQTINSSVVLPAGGCYTLVVVDDYADGFPNGYFRVAVVGGPILFERKMEPSAISDDNLIDAQLVTRLEETMAIQELSVYPNPALDALRVRFGLPEKTALSLSVVNAYGQVIQSVTENTYSAGDHAVDMDLSGLPGGVYFLRLGGSLGGAVRRFIVSRP